MRRKSGCNNHASLQAANICGSRQSCVGCEQFSEHINITRLLTRQAIIVSVAAAGHSLAADGAGGLWTWGRNDSAGGGGGGSPPQPASGQLGRHGMAPWRCRCRSETHTTLS